MNAEAHVYLETAAICRRITDRLHANWEAVPEDQRHALRSPTTLLDDLKASKHKDTEPADSADSDFAKVIEDSKFTEMDMITAMFNLVLGLAEELTGKMVGVSLRNKNGNRMPIGMDPGTVYFLNR